MVRFMGHDLVYDNLNKGREGSQMQTMYYQTSNFIQHSGNVVDLEEFRQKTALAQHDSLARQPEQMLWESEEAEKPAFRPVVLTMTKAERRQARRERHAWMLDAWASGAVVLMTLGCLLRMFL